MSSKEEAGKMNRLETIIPVQYGELSNDDLENLKLLDEALVSDQLKPTSKPLIQRVPSTLCMSIPKDFRKYFKPRVISIGPIHHDDPTLHESGHKLKLKLAAHFVKTHDVEKEILYNNIKTEIASLKKCYDPKELKSYCDDDDKLAWMFFLDGCAILQAIYLHPVNSDKEEAKASTDNLSKEKLIIKNDLLTFVYLDMFLLQNQLPYRVLELLTGSSSKGRMFMDSIKKFIDDNLITPLEKKEEQFPKQQQQQQQQPQEAEPVHLLDLLRNRLIFTNKKKPSSLCSRFFQYVNERNNKTHHSHTFRNVKELRSAGIWLKPSETSCLLDITFSRVCCKGRLRLPPITVDDSTGPKFMNLIAYEMCPDFENDFTVTSYICFLDSLIDEAEDVKELRDAEILYNGLGSDEEVAKLFNKMNTDLVPSQQIYLEVKRQIQNHCRNTWIHYAAQAYYTHFNSPWTFLAFVGAIAALLLSAIQTYYTVQQAKEPSNKKN